VDVRHSGGGTDRIVTVPNLLSLLRLLGVPVFLWLILVPHADLAAVILLAVSGATDYLDGWVARRWNQQSRLGELLDPTADRLYIFAALLGLALRGIVPWWLVGLLVIRDVILGVALLVLRGHGIGPPQVHYLGKAATLNLLYAFPLLLLGDGAGTWHEVARVLGWAFAIWGTALYWWAGLVYLRQVRSAVSAAGPPQTATHGDNREVPV
jgi:cardiolipin synthase (CMP-forming)